MTCQIELYQFKITYKNFKSDVSACTLSGSFISSLQLQRILLRYSLTTQCLKTLSDSGECILFKAFIEQYFTCV